MKLIIVIAWVFSCFNLSLLFITSRHSRKIVHLMLVTLLINIVVPMYVILNGEYNVSVTSMIFVLIIYNLITAFGEKKSISSGHSGGVKLIMASLIVVNMLTVLQLLTFDIERYDLFAYIFFSNIIVQLIILFFYNVRGIFEKEMVINLASFFSVVNSLLGIAQAATGKTFLANESLYLYRDNEDFLSRAVGFVGANNGAGNLGAILFPVLLYRFWKNKTVLNFAILALDLVYTFVTFTRTGYIAIIVEMIIFALFLIFKKSDEGLMLKKTFFAVFSFIIAYSVCALFSDDVLNLYNMLFESRSETQSLRFIQFHKALAIFSESPFLGVGVGQYVSYTLMNHFETDLEIHSQWINILVEQGIIAFISYAAYNLTLLVLLVKKCRGGDVWFGISLFAGYAVATNFNPNQYYVINIYMFYFIVCGFIFSKDNKSCKGGWGD